MPRNPATKCDITFEDRYGSTTSGNLSTHKTKVCVSNAVDLQTIQAEFGTWITIADFHYYHIKCPYSTQADYNFVLDIDPSSATYWQPLAVPGGSQTDHTSTSGIMIRHSRGSKYGWLCVDPACQYYQNNERTYFYY
ncbi:MAG: hypothetical protein ACXACY_19820 [Candidatus Hodarchaeales archaeon]|jgi:hypothetical protein